MNTTLIAFIIIIILLIVIIIYLLSINRNIQNTKNRQSITKNMSEFALDNIELPRNIERMDADSLLKATRVIVDSFKSLDYASKGPNVLDKIEWHTWQVSILLSFLKGNNRLIGVSTNEKLFHENILDLDYSQMDQEIQRVIKKYSQNVNIQQDRDSLSKDVIWSVRDVSIILYEIMYNN
jgi:competence protein ComGC